MPVVVAAAEARERRHAALECGGRLEGRASMNADRGRLIVRRRETGSEPVVTQMSRVVKEVNRKSQRRLNNSPRTVKWTDHPASR